VPDEEVHDDTEEMTEETIEETAEEQVNVREVRAASRDDLPPADSTPRQANPDGHKFLEDVKLRLSADLGSTQLTIRDILALEPGSMVELDKLAGEMIDVCVQDTYLGKGEVMVITDSLGVRLTEIGGTRENEEAVDQSEAS
jgi:flagellar motor switch protein FliN/FliY